MARQNTEEKSNDKSWILYEKKPDKNTGVGYQITYVTGDEEGTIAYGQITIMGWIAIKVGLVHSKGGHDFWSFPSKKGKDGNWYSDIIPLDKEVAGIFKEIAEEAVDVVLDELLPKQREAKKSERESRRSCK